MNRGLLNNLASLFAKLGFGFLLINLSLLYVNEAGILLLNKNIMLQFMVSVVFGFFHSVHSSQSYSCNSDSYKAGNFIGEVLIYTAWYNVVLLPPSGFGVMEIVLVVLVVFSDFIASLSGEVKEKISYVSATPWNLIIFGTILFIFKFIIIILYPSNLYIEHFVGNATARAIVLFFCILGLIIAFSIILRKFKLFLGITSIINKKTSVFIKKIFNTLVSFIKFFLNLFTGWMLIVVIILLFFLTGTAIFLLMKEIADNIFAFVEPVLIKLSDTGKAVIVESVFYYFAQAIVVMTVLIHNYIVTKNKESKSEERIDV